MSQTKYRKELKGLLEDMGLEVEDKTQTLELDTGPSEFMPSGIPQMAPISSYPDTLTIRPVYLKDIDGESESFDEIWKQSRKKRDRSAVQVASLESIFFPIREFERFITGHVRCSAVRCANRPELPEDMEKIGRPEIETDVYFLRRARTNHNWPWLGMSRITFTDSGIISTFYGQTFSVRGRI